ncbi:protein MAINTENANCE OF MERISTEMS-like isoform X2 [Daucus carota subsp. sativus]|uniref:protein MAINTENANCE OF MERISTEMS-like isoform X2 n=1 Tax=Daucus carota subsp. sativus TaxID=79200 RepID=UPI0007EF240A|nr:PREDICTED: uncharacterized protein LOC108221951 isoform X2 [Daucus carota subsp. sativus]
MTAATKGTSMLYTMRSHYDELDETFRQHLNDSQDSRCLLNLLEFPGVELMPALVCYFLKFYNITENVFCFNGQVLSISLEDVLFLTGLPIDGDAVISNDNRDVDGFRRVFQLENEKNKTFKELKKVAKDVNLDNDTRKKAVLLLMVRCFIVPNCNGHTVTTTYLRFIEDLSRVDSYAWGAALLAFLYHAIAEWKKETSAKKTLEGNTWVILSFFILRIPKLRMALSIDLNLSQLRIPFMLPIVNQVKRISRNHRANYEEVLDNIFLNLSHVDVEWTPYIRSYHPQQRFGTRVGPIICNNFVVHHQPHIAYKQFPVFKLYYRKSLDWKPYDIKFKKNSGSSSQNLLKHYKKEFEWWKAKKLAQELMKEKNPVLCISKQEPLVSEELIHNKEEEQFDYSDNEQQQKGPQFGGASGGSEHVSPNDAEQPEDSPVQDNFREQLHKRSIEESCDCTTSELQWVGLDDRISRLENIFNEIKSAKLCGTSGVKLEM